MTEVERAILRNQLMLLRTAYVSNFDEGFNRTAAAIQRRIIATEVMLFDPTTACQCPRKIGDQRWPTRLLETSHSTKLVCDICDRTMHTS